MDLLNESYRKAANYPTNLARSTFYQYELQCYLERFVKAQKNLCYDNKDSSVEGWGMHFWEYASPQHVFSGKVVDDGAILQNHFKRPNGTFQRDPVSRYVFLHAKHARAPLNITAPMLQGLLTHHQVNATVVDQLLSYGRRKHEQDFSACNFRSDICVSAEHSRVAIPELGRSGRQIELCYTLRTIEDPGAWTMRQTSVYHSFDVVSGGAFWLIIKANSLIRERLQDTTTPGSAYANPILDTTEHCLSSALSSHLVMCHWANENWRPYIAELEVKVHRLTKKVIAFDARQSKSTPTEDKTDNSSPGGLPEPSLSRKMTLKRVGTFLSHSFSRRNTTMSTAQPTQGSQDVPLNIVTATEEDEEFSIDDLQTIQTTEEKINSALLVLRTNFNTLNQLTDFYCNVSRFDGWPQNLELRGKGYINQFAARVKNIEADLKVQQLRLETLVRLLADRKALLYAIIEHRNVEANNLLAHRAQQSQKHMETVSDYMYQLAEKTQQETVSMRIITLVTLFFLPGTFICTLMSTDIIQFESLGGGRFQEQFSSKALKLFFEICIPLMFGTFVAWYMIYAWTNHRQARLKFKQGMHDLMGKV